MVRRRQNRPAPSRHVVPPCPATLAGLHHWWRLVGRARVRKALERCGIKGAHRDQVVRWLEVEFIQMRTDLERDGVPAPVALAGERLHPERRERDDRTYPRPSELP